MRETEGLDLSFEKMIVFSGNSGVADLRVSEWNDIPVELLLRILSLVDDRTVIVASGVCQGWRDAVSWGLTHLSLSWYAHSFDSSVDLFFERLNSGCYFIMYEMVEFSCFVVMSIFLACELVYVSDWFPGH